MSDKDDLFEDSKDPSADDKDKPRWSEVMRELALSGLATYFMTEDAVKGYLKELRLPKELAGVVLDGISKKKDDFYGLLVKEFGRVLNKIDITTEVSKFLEKHRIHVEVSFEPRDGSRKTEAKKPTEEVKHDAKHDAKNDQG
jgi:hypothetical protein